MLSLPILNLSGVFFEVIAFLSESFDVALVRRPGGREGREQKIEAGLEARGVGWRGHLSTGGCRLLCEFGIGLEMPFGISE